VTNTLYQLSEKVEALKLHHVYETNELACVSANIQSDAWRNDKL